MVICPEGSRAQNSIAAVSAEGSRVCVLMRRLSPRAALDGIGSGCRSRLAVGQAGEGEHPISGLVQAVGNALRLSRHLRMNDLFRASVSVGALAQIMSLCSAEVSSCSRSGGRANVLRCLCTVQRCTSASDHTRPSAFSSPAAPSMTTKFGADRPREDG
jgi:hypothetical protein